MSQDSRLSHIDSLSWFVQFYCMCIFVHSIIRLELLPADL